MSAPQKEKKKIDIDSFAIQKHCHNNYIDPNVQKDKKISTYLFGL